MTLLGGRRERACHQLEGLGRVDRPASHPTREDVKDGEAIDLALSGRVLGDVGEPELVRGWPVEVPPKQVKRYRPRRLGALRWSPVRDSLDFQLNHDRANGVLAYRVSPAEPKLGGDPGDPVGAARLLVDLGDLLRRSDPPECGSGERSVLPGVVTAP